MGVLSIDNLAGHKVFYQKESHSWKEQEQDLVPGKMLLPAQPPPPQGPPMCAQQERNQPWSCSSALMSLSLSSVKKGSCHYTE
ncbi:Calcium Uptake Protein 3 [Manis pentadactyla]|nr:Calcium Uptake Protein 3 [Manis pentadactyla]